MAGASFTYVHRGAPGNTLTVRAEDMTTSGHTFFSIADSTIPYHRIVKIEQNGEVLFDIENIKKRMLVTTKTVVKGFDHLDFGSLQFGHACMKAGYCTPHLLHLIISVF
jgi:uncharacterized protein (UPF0248 family)